MAKVRRRHRPGARLRSMFEFKLQLKLAFLRNALERLTGILDAVLVVVTVGWQQPHNLVAAARTGTADRTRRVEYGLTDTEPVGASNGLKVVTCATVTVVVFAGFTRDVDRGMSIALAGWRPFFGRADGRGAALRTAARAGDLRTGVLRAALAGRFFLTERLFMEQLYHPISQSSKEYSAFKAGFEFP